ncbi:hypothetical protein [Arcobacter peruensis]|uniref:hypothetical protein n=1 Tax=Arcobacter peruensis TaxID=2320140 RepID=UPI000F08A423|nr:hypothetical protein [Arcobacter peruensis]
MEDESLRIAIYERLGLEFGSLPSESGNDWQRAKEEVLTELKAKEFEKFKNLTTIDYLTIDKNSEEFKLALNSNSLLTQNYKILIAKREDLIDDEINYLINQDNKDISINIARYQQLNISQIDRIIPNSVFLTKKYLIESQNLNNEQKQQLNEIMSLNKSFYKDLIEKINK